MKHSNVASLVACAAAALALASGCTSTSVDHDGSEADKALEQYAGKGIDRGVSWISPSSDVVVLQASYRHVVLPSGETVMYRPEWDEEKLSEIAQTLDERAQIASNLEAAARQAEKGESSAKSNLSDSLDEGSRSAKEDRSDKQSHPDEDESVVSAWRKLCENRVEDMSEGDFFLVQTTDLPESLSDECDQRQAFARLK